MNMLTLSTININWEILLANGFSFLIVTLLCLLVYVAVFALTYAIVDTMSGYSFYKYNDSKVKQFFKTNLIIVPIALIAWGIIAWGIWSTKLLNKPENADKPIIEHIQEK